jgi:WD40 repeat protein
VGKALTGHDVVDLASGHAVALRGGEVGGRNAFSANGAWLGALWSRPGPDRDGELRVWNTVTGDLSKRLAIEELGFDHYASGVDVFAFSDDSARIAGGFGWNLEVWGLPEGGSITRTEMPAAVTSVAFLDARGSTVVFGCYDGSVGLVNVDDGKS